MPRALLISSFVVAAACAPRPTDPPAVRPNLLLVTIDTLRADRLGAGFTPVLDGLAARGVRFTEARTVAPLTLPAHTSILTGQLPSAHGVRLNGVTARPTIGEIFNLFNSKNPSTFVASRASGRFMQPNEFSGDFQNPEQRVGQVGFRFSF